MGLQKVILTEPPPPLKQVLVRSTLAMGVVLAATVMVTMLWRTEQWPGELGVRALVLGFGIAFGGRFGARGRIRGANVAITAGLGALASVGFYALWMFAGS